VALQVSLPPLDADPPASDAEDARFDVRREKQVLLPRGCRNRASASGGRWGPFFSLSHIILKV